MLAIWLFPGVPCSEFVGLLPPSTMSVSPLACVSLNQLCLLAFKNNISLAVVVALVLTLSIAA